MSDFDFPADIPDCPELVSCRREGHLAWLTIERPEVMNCLSFPTLRRFRTLVAEVGEDASIRCVLITGAGEKAFCAGADLKERKSMPTERVPIFLRHNTALMSDIAALPQPVIGVVNGFALGGGMEMLLACDLRVAAATATFGLPETGLAIIPGAGGTQRLPRLIGASRAKDLILTARRIDAGEALTLGLVNRVAEPGGLIECATELAEKIAANGPLAVRAAKSSIDGGAGLSMAEALAVEGRCYETILESSDRLEALEAFVEKRKPRFTGA
jgi:enoyl-CoA hydratase/carnithine racemase